MKKFYQKYAFINAIKASIALFIGYAVGWVFPSNFQSWIAITIVIVMATQITVASARYKGYLRLFGTILGSLAAMSTLFVSQGHQTGLLIGLMVFGGIFIYIAVSSKTKSYVGVIGAVTVSVIILHPQASYIFALQRSIQIAIGIIIAILVNYTILPIRTETQLRDSLALCINVMRHIVLDHIKFLKSDSENLAINSEIELFSYFKNQSVLLNEAKLERKLNVSAYNAIDKSVRELNRVLFVLSAYTKSNKKTLKEHHISDILEAYFHTIYMDLKKIEHALVKKCVPEDLSHENYLNYYEALEKLLHPKGQKDMNHFFLHVMTMVEENIKTIAKNVSLVV